MADEPGVHITLTIKGLFEGEDDQHLRDVSLHKPNASLLPGPKLRAHEINDGDTEMVEFLRQLEMNVREIDEDRDIGAPGVNGGLETTKLAIDARKMADHFRNAHHRHIFRTD